LFEQYWEGTSIFIYNIKFNEYRCKTIDVPYFNNSRTYLLSLSYYDSLSEATEYSLKIFKIDNGYYNEIHTENIYIYHKWFLKEIK